MSKIDNENQIQTNQSDSPSQLATIQLGNTYTYRITWLINDYAKTENNVFWKGWYEWLTWKYFLYSFKKLELKKGILQIISK